MNHTPEQQWSALSALYEEADGLPTHELPGWLAQLERDNNPLLPQLKRMLEAREHMDSDGFLGTLPKLSSDVAGASDWKEGARVGPYRLVKPLGEGGMAEVWLAERDDGAFKRRVAIKLPYPRPGRETFALRFDRERDILATLRHPHIAGLYDAGVTKDGQAWLALEYVEGQPMSVFCDERRLNVRERVMLFRQVLLAVQHAHANLVIHRDLKPANILVTAQGEVRLLDFGIAKLLEAQGDAIEETELTRQAGRSMTPRYASPEQLMGLPLTTACDVYSLGVVFYELVSGERPYELKVESPAQLEHAILDAEPRAPSRRALSEAMANARATTVKGLRKVLAPELDAIALRCLEKKPSARYLSVDAVLADVDRWLGGEAVLARAPGAWYRFGKFALRHRLAVGLTVAAVVGMVTATTVAIVFAMQAREDSARAMAARDFMLGLFQRADSEKSRGADITARELLETGRNDLLKRLNGQPMLQGDLLQGIGLIQMQMGEYAPADGTLLEAVRVFSSARKPRDEAMARVALAEVALRMANPSLASTRLAEAKAVNGLPSKDAELNVRIAEVGGWISSVRAQGSEARDKFQSGYDEALKAFGADDVRTVRLLRGLIYSEHQLRHFDRALGLQASLELAERRRTDTDPKQLALSAVERADLLYAAGRYAAGLEHDQLSLSHCIETVGPNDQFCRRLLLNKVSVLLRMGRVADARSSMPQLLALASDDKAPIVQNEALLLAYRIEATQRLSSDLALDLESRVRKLGLSGAEMQINPTFKLRALLTLAESHLLAHDIEGADVLLAQVLGPHASYDPEQLPPLLIGVANSFAGVVALSNNDVAAALSLLMIGERKLVEALGANHPLVHIFRMNTAVAMTEVGRSSEALAIADEAERILSQSMGPEAPNVLRVVGFKARLAAAVRSREAAVKGRVAPKQLRVDLFS